VAFCAAGPSRLVGDGREVEGRGCRLRAWKETRSCGGPAARRSVLRCVCGCRSEGAVEDSKARCAARRETKPVKPGWPGPGRGGAWADSEAKSGMGAGKGTRRGGGSGSRGGGGRLESSAEAE
jgi:hypothetical protein